MRVLEASNRTSLGSEVLELLTQQAGREHLNRRFRTQVNMLTQVDIGKSSLPEQSDQSIVAKLLTNTISHSRILSGSTLLSTPCPLENSALSIIVHP
jgi:hypothetical protein